jgi:type IV pilus assembly protein PilN
MIRINLLPQKKRAQRPEGSQLWMVVIMVLFLGEVAGLFVYHGSKAEELNTQKRTNAALQGQIDHAKKAVANHAQVKAALATLRAREKAIAALQRARTGPTAMMLELARILTPGRGPSVAPEKLNEIRRDNPLADFNRNWDARRLWLTQFVEDARHVRLTGRARDGEDVSELARRMGLSSFFEDVRLLPAKKIKSKDNGLDLVQFQLEAKARY